MSEVAERLLLPEGEDLQGSHESARPGLAERGEEPAFCLGAGLLGLPQAIEADRGEFHDVLAAVLRAAMALDESLALQIVDQGHHRRAVDAEPPGRFQL